MAEFSHMWAVEKRVPAYGRICQRCNKKNHYAQYCKTKNAEHPNSRSPECSKVNKIGKSSNGKRIGKDYSDTTSEEEEEYDLQPYSEVN